MPRTLYLICTDGYMELDLNDATVHGIFTNLAAAEDFVGKLNSNTFNIVPVTAADKVRIISAHYVLGQTIRARVQVKQTMNDYIKLTPLDRRTTIYATPGEFSVKPRDIVEVTVTRLEYQSPQRHSVLKEMLWWSITGVVTKG